LLLKNGNNVERVCRKISFRFLGNNVARFGNNVERNFVLSTKSKQIEHVQFKLNMFNLFRLCRKDEISFDMIAASP